jgi:hypothetical protein
MDLNDLLSSIGLQGLLGYGQQDLTASQIANQKLRSMNYEPMNFVPDRPMMDMPQRNPSDVSFAMMPYMGSPGMPNIDTQSIVDKIASQEASPTQRLNSLLGFASEMPKNQPSAINLTGGMSTFNDGSTKGVGMGGRVGAELPLDERVRMQLGVSGGGQDITYAMGTPYEGRSARYDITGIDATIRDLAKNREFGAEVKKAFGNSLLPSIFYRQRF